MARTPDPGSSSHELISSRNSIRSSPNSIRDEPTNANRKYRRHWRWKRPHFYYPAALHYRAPGVDENNNAGHEEDYFFECTIDPYTEKLERLCVQATAPICEKTPCTWNRTVISSVAPMILRIANYPFHIYYTEKHNVLKICLAWILSVTCLTLIALFGLLFQFIKLFVLPVISGFIPFDVPGDIFDLFAHSQTPDHGNTNNYTPFYPMEHRYARQATNSMENMKENTIQCNPPEQTYRTGWPRMLCYSNDDGSIARYKQKFVDEVPQEYKSTPYVFIAYTKSDFPEDSAARLDRLTTAATAAISYYNERLESSKVKRAFWLADLCMPNDMEYIGGQRKLLDVSTDDGKRRQTQLENSNVYTMSDIIRYAEKVIIISDPMNDKVRTEDDILRGWCDRAWTLPEILLSSGGKVEVLTFSEPHGPERLKIIEKKSISHRILDDKLPFQDLLSHFANNIQLSRLELVERVLNCLMVRKLDKKYDGDLSYILMGLLRIRPPINHEDSSFQAFARLSMPQDNDRLMERLICLLPENPDDPWDCMTDMYKSKLWDIYPDTQVCGVGENDTVYVDGFKGATIHWSKFYTVHKTPSAQSIQIIFVVYGPPILFLVGLVLIIIFQTPHEGVDITIGIGLLVSSILFQLLAPYFIRRLYKDKSNFLDPYFFGIEGYVSIEEIEAKMFGRKLDILSWHPWGSPLSCHEKGGEHTEWACPLHDNSGLNDNLAAEQGLIHTWDIKPKDPGVDDCNKIKPDIKQKISSKIGETKIFTLVDTYSKTVTLFEAKRPPTVLLIGGSEGGMKRALACSYDAINGTIYRETVLRLRSDVAAQMPDVPRIRLGLRRPFLLGR